jgi:hypothetical protein
MTHDYVIQVSDRRLSYLDKFISRPSIGSHYNVIYKTRTAEDSANKAVMFCRNLVFGYTGQARLDKTKTDLWLSGLLADENCTSSMQAVELIQDAATKVFQKPPITLLEARFRSHTFVAVGWGIPPTSPISPENLTPLICSISNQLDENGNWVAQVQNKFNRKLQFLENTKLFEYLDIGQPLTQTEKEETSDLVRRCIKRGAKPDAIVRVFRDKIRQVADREPTVGKNLLAIVFPKTALLKQQGFTMVHSNSMENNLTFLSLPQNTNDTIEYGPNYVCGGYAITEYQATSSGTPGEEDFRQEISMRYYRVPKQP